MSMAVEIAERRGYYSFEMNMKRLIERLPDNNERWRSPDFSCMGELWYLIIYPEKDESGTLTRWINLYLLRANSQMDCKISVCLTLGLKETDGTYHKSISTTHCFANAVCTFQWSHIMNIGEYDYEFSKRRLGHIMTVYCEMRLKEECRADAESLTLAHDDTAVLVQNVSDLYLKQQLCDVTIYIGEREFQAHRSILGARSAIFAAMFEHDMKEKNSGEIIIDDCDPDTFHDFLLYLYTAKVDIISRKNVIALYCIADKYDLSQLMWWCEQFLLQNLSVEIFCDALSFAIKYNKSTLIKASEDFFTKYSEEILVTVNWQNFMKENCIVANELFIKCTQSFKKLISTK